MDYFRSLVNLLDTFETTSSNSTFDRFIDLDLSPSCGRAGICCIERGRGPRVRRQGWLVSWTSLAEAER